MKVVVRLPKGQSTVYGDVTDAGITDGALVIKEEISYTVSAADAAESKRLASRPRVFGSEATQVYEEGETLTVEVIRAVHARGKWHGYEVTER
jgi:hypothetical protein